MLLTAAPYNNQRPEKAVDQRVVYLELLTNPKYSSLLLVTKTHHCFLFKPVLSKYKWKEHLQKACIGISNSIWCLESRTLLYILFYFLILPAVDLSISHACQGMNQAWTRHNKAHNRPPGHVANGRGSIGSLEKAKGKLMFIVTGFY